jgi:hypothetical protein
MTGAVVPADGYACEEIRELLKNRRGVWTEELVGVAMPLERRR